ncbi:hypothetical protein [Bifidobacterium sp. M3-N-101]|nr:hypothetical protein [Bifidobacterium sp. M3-N-101]
MVGTKAKETVMQSEESFVMEKSAGTVAKRWFSWAQGGVYA